MSRIDDENTDQRIREMQETQLQRQKVEEKKTAESRFDKTLSQALGERGRREGEKTAHEKQNTRDKAGEHQSALSKLKKDIPKSAADLARRAALSRALQGGTAAKRAQEHQTANVAAEARTEELRGKTAEDIERVDKESREIDDKGDRIVEEKQAETKKDSRLDGPIDQDKQHDKEKRGGQQKNRDDQRSENVQGVDGPKAAHVVNIPRELIDKLVSAIQTAVNADGRTSMVVTLKGGKLEGVKMSISAEGGKVSCEIEGCDRETSALLKGGKSVLAGALSKRGLKLVKLDVR